MAGRRHNFYREANPTDSEEHPIDEEIERRLRHAALRKRIHVAQGHVVAALGEQRHLYLQLEQLLGDHAIDREEAFFNIGYEHGLVAGRAEALAASIRRPGSRHRALATDLARLAVAAGRPPASAAALGEVAGALLVGERGAGEQGRRRRSQRSK